METLKRQLSFRGKSSSANLDKIIEQLLSFDQSKGTEINLKESDIIFLATKSRQLFLSQPTFLELEAPIKVVGDIHGQFGDLLRIFHHNGKPPQSNYVFLGDYVDRGKYSIESICLLFAYKLKFDENFFLLRGNHECASITRIYGFYDECKRRYSVKLWKIFTNTFNCLPIAACIADKIFCVHGGISQEFESFKQIKDISRPTDIPDSGILCDLLWADPENINGWKESDRGVSYVFGPAALNKFQQKADLELVGRAHQVVEDGYEFFNKRSLVTIFSAPNYCGQFDNCAGVMSVTDKLQCGFSILKPVKKSRKK